MSSIRWKEGDTNVYLRVNAQWYRYDSSQAPIGEGGMGIVYLGFNCQTNEKVAIKMLRQEFWGNQDIRNRLKLEASIQLNHPNVIKMIGFTEFESGQGPLFILSEYVYGVTFMDHLQQLTGWLGKDKPYKILYEFCPVLDAVSHMHSLGIVHRDIKPTNIMLQDGYNLKLMDLGIAKADHFFDAHLKGFIGTLPYAAPEQRVADNVEAKVDHRADIYSIGVTLIYLLTGHHQLLQSDDLPKGLKKIIQKATMEDVGLRYQSADEMKFAIEDFLSKQNRKKHKWLIPVGILLLLLIAMILTTL